MTALDTKIVQAAGNLHHEIRKALFGQAQDIFDNAPPFDPRDNVLDHHPRAGEDTVEDLISDAQFLAFRLFLGCLVITPGGS